MLRQVEQDAKQQGVDLMVRAARAAADWLIMRLVPDEVVWVAAGIGNNGADALIAAELLHRAGVKVICLIPLAPSSPECQLALARCEAFKIPVYKGLSEILNTFGEQKPAWMVDGLLGVGLNRAPSEKIGALIEWLNEKNVRVLALDVPSGVNAQTGQVESTAVCATHTLTFLCQKIGLWTSDGVDMAGKVTLAGLDFPTVFEQCAIKGYLNVVHDQALRQLKRPRNSHKGRFGSAAVVGGCEGMVGAALLTARAAMATGAGKVWVNALDERLLVDVNAPELMIRQSSADLSTASAVAIGPGLGQSEHAYELLKNALSTAVMPLILDADALNLVAKEPLFKKLLQQRKYITVVTPHPTEAARLLNTTTQMVQNDRVSAACTIASEYNSVVVLKGAGSIIADSEGYYRVNTSGGSELAAAGQGDVLSGVIVALLAQSIPAFDAAALAVYVHGRAGDLYREKSKGVIGLSASATVPLISSIMNQCLAELDALA